MGVGCWGLQIVSCAFRPDPFCSIHPSDAMTHTMDGVCARDILFVTSAYARCCVTGTPLRDIKGGSELMPPSPFGPDLDGRSGVWLSTH